ncbi:non-ribosomal peptide synthetase [Streptococcus macacae]|uniref:AMP-binding enzyme n=1 Tax=Streptococcus macacae NCTC 11558 TaxID=764298 RepID=G5JUF7_9STRE|nr:non-ribosomal peptide synthetase [Streptococcus macacae]EHJ52313.1 AMP-binding enzyme [Streptococcus macacae NCTC 11558]SUN78599.1 putative non-ribosomal peptide sythetase [Streptococcus macacae NCTC 11558]
MKSDEQNKMNDQNKKSKAESLLAKRLGKQKKQREIRFESNFLQEYGVSSIQKNMLENEEMDDKVSAYNLVSAVDVSGRLDLEALRQAFNCLIQSNSSLKTKFTATNDGYKQIIEEVSFADLDYIDLSEKSNGESELKEIILSKSLQKMPLESSPLLQLSVIQLKSDQFVIVLVAHHTVMDGWSFGLAVHQLQDYYNLYKQNGTIAPASEKYNTIDYLIWKNRNKKDSKSYWIKELTNTNILRLESDFERGVQSSYRGKRLYFTLDKQLTELMKQYEKVHHITVANIILSAYQILLHKYTGQNDFVIGTAVADRENIAVRNMIGCLINTLGVRTIINDDLEIKDYLEHTQKHFYEIMKHKDIDLYECLEELEYEQDNRFSTLFQAMYNYENTPKAKMNFKDLDIGFRNVEAGSALFDLTLSIFDTDDGLNGFIEYKADLFKPSRIEQLLQCFIHILNTIVKKPEIAVKDISLLSPQQESELLEINTKKEIKETLFTDKFKKIVSKYGKNTALSFEKQSVTYEQLDIASDIIAQQLLNQAAPKSLIGVFMNKSIDAIVAMLSILKAGMVYVPIDTGYPIERIRYITKDAGIYHLLTHKQVSRNIDWQSLGIKNINDIEEMQANLTLTPPSQLSKVSLDAEDTAYIIYTSGSTGKPKGVMVAHRGLCNIVEEQNNLFAVDDKSKVLQFASFCFDASVFEIVMALGNGAELHIVDKDQVLGDHLTQFIKDKAITHICVTPSVLSLASSETLDKLETIIVAGEACPSELVNMWGKHHQFFNAYGPTEATIWTTTKRCLPNSKVTIGKPLNNVEVFVLDEQLNMLPKGNIGELYIGGIGVCKGYLHREELNHQKFVQKTFSDGHESTLYATGDIVRWDENGELEFMGRKDNQVKLRGFRIEIDEIRSKILEYPDTQDAVIGITNKDGMDLLYAVIKNKLDINDSKAFKDFLKGKLPYYMIPSLINFVDEIPLTWNGKVDSKQIEENLIFYTDTKRDLKEPTTKIQRELLTIWQTILATEAISTDDNFFELGGHSLIATKLINAINQQFQIDLTANMIFNYPTILEMEAYLEKLDRVSDSLPIKKVERQKELLLSPQQKQLWLMEQMVPQNGNYNIVTPIRLKGNLNIKLLEKSFNQLIKNHEILRVNFHDKEGVPYQIINEKANIRLQHHYLMNFDLSQAESIANTILAFDEKRPFNLSSELLIRSSLIHLNEEEYILIIVMHHIISDGWSMELLIDELSEIYNKLLKRQEDSMLPKQHLSLQYLDYTYWLDQEKNREKKQKEFWKNTLSSDMPALSFPADYKRPAIQTHNGYTVEQILDEELSHQLKKFCQDNNITTFMFMLTIFSILLHKLSGEEDLPIGVPVAGRTKKEMENMIGFFVNTVVMRCKLNTNLTILDYLEVIRNTTLLAFENQDVPFDDIVQMLSPSRDTSRSPLVQVMLNVQNPEGIKCHMDGLEAAPYPLTQEITKFDATLYVEEYFGKMKFRLVYNSDLYKEESMQEYLRQLNTVMVAVLQNKKTKIKDISIQSQHFSQLLKAKETLADSSLIRFNSSLCIDEVVSRNAAKYPERLAISDESGSLTYLQLEEKSEKLAAVLSNQGLGKGSIFVIYGDRNMKLIISMLAILKIGGIFCIFDPEYPEIRLKKQLESIKADGAIVINHEELKNADFLNKNLKLYNSYDELMHISKEQPLVRQAVTKDIKDTAYILFTSGTTGKPNCVSTSHEPINHFIKWFVKHYQLDESSVFGLFAGLSHDPLIRDIFTPLFIGGRLAIQNQKSRYDIEDTGQWINDQGINEINITPSLFLMLSEGDNISFPKVKHYFFGGELLTAAPVQRAQTISPMAQCVNFYGTTETPQVMGFYDIPEDFDLENNVIPIGSGIDAVRLSLLNDAGLETGVGELGEIYVETSYLSEGYVNNEALNLEKFFNSQNQTGWRRYKTGDVGRYQYDGSIVIEGRKDTQINVRGYRVEAEEIELSLAKHDNIRRSVVYPVSVKGRKQLIAYLEVIDQKAFTTSDIRDFLRTYIPENIIPERFVLVSQIPLTPNGKVDYRKLPKEFTKQTPAITQPKDIIERKIKQIWLDVLNIDDISTDENFFDAGGHSLLLSRIKVLLEQKLNVNLKLMDLFSYPTIKLISDYIKQKTEGVKHNIKGSHIADNTSNRINKQRQSFGNFKR